MAPYFIFFENKTPPSETYLFDDFSNGRAGFSLQRLNSGTSDVVFVRNTTNNAERWFSPEEVVQGPLLSWLGSNPGRIVELVNQDLSGDNITEVFTNSGPLIANGGSLYLRSGLPAMYFGGSQVLRTATTVLNNTNISVYTIGAAASTSTAGITWALHTSTTATLRGLIDSRSTFKRNTVGYGSTSNAFADMSTFRVNTDDRLLEAHIDGSHEITGYDNDTLGTTDSPVGTTGSTSGFQIGRQTTSLTYLNGYISLIAGFNVNNEASRSSVVTKIESLYGSF